MPENKDFKEVIKLIETTPYPKISKEAINYISNKFDQYSYLMSILEIKKQRHL